MKFSHKEKEALLAIKGVGPTVIERFEQVGISSFEELKRYQVQEITDLVSKMLNSTCWKNSPQAKASVAAAIELAKAN